MTPEPDRSVTGAAGKHVVVVTTDLQVGGAQVLLVDLVRHLRDTGWKVTVFSLESEGPLDDSIVATGATVQRGLRRWRFDLVGPVRELRKLCSETPPHAVICFGVYENVFWRLASVGRRSRPATVVGIHATTVAGRRKALLVWLECRLLRRDARLVSVCDAQAEYWSKAYRIDRRRFTTVYNGVDVRRFCLPTAADRLSARAAIGISAGAFVITQVASLLPYKWHEGALNALRLLGVLDHDLAPCLVLVGTASAERTSALQSLAKELGVWDQVRFVGLSDDVTPYLVAADAFTLSSTMSEAFSIAALEAMATGLPLVLSDVGGAREMIVEDVNGYVVSAGDADALARAWLNVARRQPQFDAATIRRLAVERFDVADCLAAYERLLSD